MDENSSLLEHIVLVSCYICGFWTTGIFRPTVVNKHHTWAAKPSCSDGNPSTPQKDNSSHATNWLFSIVANVGVRCSVSPVTSYSENGRKQAKTSENGQMLLLLLLLLLLNAIEMTTRCVPIKIAGCYFPWIFTETNNRCSLFSVKIFQSQW